MSKTITIGGNIIDFPTSAESPNWAPALVDFADAVEGALSGLAGTYDVSPQIYTLISDVNTNVDLPKLSFPTSNVRGAFIRYAYHRNSNTTREVESGNLIIIYDDTAGSWQISRDSVGTATRLSFNITNTGQVQFSTTAIGGTFTAGTISYQANSLLKA